MFSQRKNSVLESNDKYKENEKTDVFKHRGMCGSPKPCFQYVHMFKLKQDTVALICIAFCASSCIVYEKPGLNE